MDPWDLESRPNDQSTIHNSCGAMERIFVTSQEYTLCDINLSPYLAVLDRLAVIKMRPLLADLEYIN